MQATKRIALVAHDERKADLLAWVRRNSATFFIISNPGFNTAYEQELKDYSAYTHRSI